MIKPYAGQGQLSGLTQSWRLILSWSIFIIQTASFAAILMQPG